MATTISLEKMGDVAAMKWQIRQLEGKPDWFTWKTRIEYHMSAAAADVMLGRSERPDDGDDATIDQRKAVHVWDKADREAVSALLHSVNDDNVQKISRFRTSRERWLELVRLYDGSAGEKSFDLCMQFFGYVKSTSDDVGTHMSKLKNIWNELKLALASEDANMNVKLPDMFLECKVLDTLPESFFAFKSSWMLIDKKQRTVENLTDQLCSYERALDKRSTDDATGEALAVKMTHRGKGGISKHKKQFDKSGHASEKGPQCYGCKEFGHIKRNCPKSKESTRPLEDGVGQKHDGKMLLVLSNAFGVCAESDAWYADTGATRHISKNGSVFESFEKFGKGQCGAMTADGTFSEAIGQGIVNVRVSINGRWENRKLCNVWFVPGMKANLFSVTSAQDRFSGSRFVSSATCCKLLDGHKNVLVMGHRERGGGLYKLAMEADMRTNCISLVNLMSADRSNDLQTWHERFCHQDKRHVQRVLKSMNIETDSNFGVCEGCAYGKAHRLPFGKRPRASKAGEIVHADLCGPFDESFSRFKFFVCFKDDFTRYRSVYFMKSKSEATAKLIEFLAEVKTLGHVIKELRCDNGGEFTAGSFRNELVKHGIKFSPSEPYTPQQNGSAERENRTIVEAAARAIRLAHRGFSKRLWAELTSTAVYVLNRTGPTGVDGKSPFELWRGQKPSIKHLRVIGTTCYVHVPDGQRKKMDSKAVKGYLIGYDDDNGYRIVTDQSGRSLLRSRNVIFDTEPCARIGSNVVKVQIATESMESSKTESSSDGEQDYDEIRNDEVNDRLLDFVVPGTKKNVESAWCFVMSAGAEPTTFYEAEQASDGDKWKMAMENEIKSLAQNDTWHLVDLPYGRKAIDTKWVYKRKLNPDGSVDKYKARLVARGFAQRKGVDYDDTFSPVAKSSTIRMIESVAANEGMSLTKFDVSTAFLYGELKETIYVKQPDGFNDGSGKVCLLKRSLYGLKQSPRCWNRRFGAFMAGRGFRVSKADPCLFIKDNEQGKLLLALYVDDGLIASNNDEATTRFIKELRDEFKVTVNTDAS